MALIFGHDGIILLIFLAIISSQLLAEGEKIEVPFNRSIFPADFLFGTSSASYQYEGAVTEGGRGPSIWDTFVHLHPEKIVDRTNANIADDFYHRYKEDIGLLDGMGMDAFRFSIAWPRILPKGTLKGGINKEGIKYYNNLIDEIVAKGMEPFVTLFHFDLPQALETDYLGLLSPRFVDDYRDYAELCFKEFGDRVKHWITFNEPWGLCERSYSVGAYAPGRCSPGMGNCTAGNSSTEPYLCVHHTILAHASAAHLYRQKYKPIQKGKIGLTMIVHWFIPYSNTKADEDAVYRALDFMLGSFVDPLTQGDYPFTMRAVVGDRLPTFSSKQSQYIKGTLDFLGVNYYTTYYVKSVSFLDKAPVLNFDSDLYVDQTGVRGGVAIGPEAASAGIFTYPKGLRDLLIYIKERYNRPEIYITETGTSESGDPSIPLKQALKDTNRVNFYKGHFYYLHKAIKEGANVKGIFAWTLLDTWEWTSGYSVRFGIIYIDRLHKLKRIPKASYYWIQKFLKP